MGINEFHESYKLSYFFFLCHLFIIGQPSHHFFSYGVLTLYRYLKDDSVEDEIVATPVTHVIKSKMKQHK